MPVVKNPAADARDVGSIPGSGKFPGGGNGNLLQFSCLENPMDRQAWQATVHRVTKCQTRKKQLNIQGVFTGTSLTFLSCLICCSSFMKSFWRHTGFTKASLSNDICSLIFLVLSWLYFLTWCTPEFILELGVRLGYNLIFFPHS